MLIKQQILSECMGEFPSFDYHTLSGAGIIDNVGVWTEVLGKNTPIAQDLPSQQNCNTICFFSKVDRAFDNAFDRVVEQMHLDSTDGTQAFTAQTSTAQTDNAQANTAQSDTAQTHAARSFECRLLLACCRTTPAQGSLERLLGGQRSQQQPTDQQFTVPQDESQIDWELLLRLAAKHRLLPLLNLHAKAYFAGIAPKSWMRRLENRVQTNAERCNRLAAEMVIIQQQLANHRIDSIAFKGTVLSEYIYGDIGLRQGWDIDLLIHQKQAPSAIEVFSHMGYRVVKRYDQAVDLVHNDTGIPIDLHWGLVPKYFPYQERVDLIFERAIRWQTGCGEVSMMCDEDLAAVLCLQIAKDAWERRQRIPYFFKIVDLSEFIQRTSNRDEDPVDWSRVRTRAEDHGWLGIMELALGSVAYWLGVRIPESERILRRKSPVSEGLIENLGLGVFNATDEVIEQGPSIWLELQRRWRQGLFFMRIRERHSDKLRYLANAVYHGVPEVLLGNHRNRSLAQSPGIESKSGEVKA
jgi:hypothetical protein